MMAKSPKNLVIIRSLWGLIKQRKCVRFFNFETGTHGGQHSVGLASGGLLVGLIGGKLKICFLFFTFETGNHGGQRSGEHWWWLG